MSKQSDDSHGEKRTKQRLQKIFRGAFSGPPTPLNAIPKKNGESRAAKAISKKRATKKTKPKKKPDKQD